MRQTGRASLAVCPNISRVCFIKIQFCKVKLEFIEMFESYFYRNILLIKYLALKPFQLPET